MEHDDRDFYLYACTSCGKFFVLHVDSSERQQCPSGHEVTIVGPRTTYRSGTYRICLTDGCDAFMKMDRHFKSDNTCESCKKPGPEIKDVVYSDGYVNDEYKKLAVAVEPMKPTEADGRSRGLAAALDKADEFTTSHHDNRPGRHTAGQTATHDRGDKENARIRKQQKTNLEKILEQLQKAGGYDEHKFRDVVKRAEQKIAQLS